MRALFALLSALSVRCGETQAETVADIEDHADLFTKLLRDGIKSSGLDPLSLPGFSAEFKQYQLVRLGPALNLRDGTLRGLSNVQKTQDIVLMLGTTFKGDLRFEFQSITATYSGKLILSREDHDLKIAAEILGLEVYINVMEETKGELKIRQFELKIKGFSIAIDCHRSAHLKLAAAFNKLNSVLKGRLEIRLNAVLKHVIQSQIVKLIEP